MTDKDLNRKLFAFLSADAVGYSRLMRANEEATVHTLTKYRKIMTELVLKYHGRVVDSPGDNILAEFVSVVHAVQCAFEIQRAIKSENDKLPEDRRMEFRLGVNLGDVIQDGDRIYGDGVNVAARMESLAEAGGICVSGSAYDQIENKLAFACEYLGEQTVKNIDAPIRVYKLSNNDTIQECSFRPPGRAAPRRFFWGGLFLLLIIIVVGGLVWHIYHRQAATTAKSLSSEKQSTPLPDKPSIAVLPFNNLSGDPQQEYFTDGITEDLITDLSKISGLLVVSRSAVFRYKNQNVKPRQLRRELGVHYAIEGSVQKVGNKVRANAQLISTASGYHVWAERYDYDINELFALQDQLTGRIVDALKITLSKSEKALLKKGGTNVPDAYDTLLRARKSYVRWTPESNKLTLALQKKAIELDPQFVLAYTEYAYTHFQKWALEGSIRPETLLQGLKIALEAVKIDENFAPAHMMVGWMQLWSRQHEAALNSMKRAIELDPNYSEGMARLGEALMFNGSSEEALHYSLMARERVMIVPYSYNFWLGEVYFYLNRHRDAIKELTRAIESHPNFFPVRRFIAAVYVEMGQLKEAKEQVKTALRINPKLSIGLLRRQLPFRNTADLERQLEALRKAGLPEQ